MCALYDKGYDPLIIQGKKVAIIGYNSQGHVHACNLRDSGVDVTVGLRSGSTTMAKAETHGLKVAGMKTTVAAADVVMILTSDEFQDHLYKEETEPNLKKGTILAFAYGFSIRYDQVVLCTDLDVTMVAPRAPGRTVRSEFVKGGSIPNLIVIYQDASGNAKNATLPHACGAGGGRTGIIEIVFKDETETDLSGEQVALCGGCVELVRAGFEILAEAGYAPEMAYFECLHELKLIVDLIYEGDIADANYSISNDAEYGEYVTGPEVINVKFHAAIHNTLKRIQDGEYVKTFTTEDAVDYPLMTACRRNNTAHPIGQIGEKLRAVTPQIAASKIVDKSRN